MNYFESERNIYFLSIIGFLYAASHNTNTHTHSNSHHYTKSYTQIHKKHTHTHTHMKHTYIKTIHSDILRYSLPLSITHNHSYKNSNHYTESYT